MARTPHSDPQAESNFNENDVSKRDLLGNGDSSRGSDMMADEQQYDTDEQNSKNSMLRTMQVRSTLGLIQRSNKARY